MFFRENPGESSLILPAVFKSQNKIMTHKKCQNGPNILKNIVFCSNNFYFSILTLSSGVISIITGGELQSNFKFSHQDIFGILKQQNLQKNGTKNNFRTWKKCQTIA